MRNFLSGALSLVIFAAFCYGIYRYAKWQKLLPPWSDDPTPTPKTVPLPAPTLGGGVQNAPPSYPGKPVIAATTSVMRDKNGNV